ncbi:proteasome subunit beta type-4-like protein [Tanacetum coccineum]
MVLMVVQIGLSGPLIDFPSNCKLSAKALSSFHEMDNLLSSEGDSQRTQYPYVTGTSVIGIKYKDGILMAADMGGSYGSTIRYKSIERLKQVGKYTLLGASGEISDYQEILKYLDELIECKVVKNGFGRLGYQLGFEKFCVRIEYKDNSRSMENTPLVILTVNSLISDTSYSLHDNMWDDGNSLGPKEVHNYLTRVMYNRRNKFDPLWNSLILGGVKNGQKYLGSVSMIGVHFEDDHVATGFGNHLARPILREEWRDDLTFEEGVKLLEKCMRNLLYRDRSAVNKVQIAKITEEGMTISQPYSLKTYWDFAAFKNPTVGAEGSW